MGLSRDSGDEKALVKVEFWNADKGGAQEKDGFLMKEELCLRSSGNDESPVQKEQWSQSAGDAEALVKMEL